VFQDNFLESMYVPHQELDRYPRIKSRVESIRDVDDVPGSTQ
jgi:hypothetical protein